MLDLSLCMIVKNEERVLQRCLDSVKGIVDEIIIADTGSTDNTVKIASKYTNNIYHYEWTDSFSDARNFAQTKATCKWILILDADEFVDRDNLIVFKEMLVNRRDKIDSFFTTIYNFMGKNGEYITQHKSLRVYRNISGIKFTRSIHEQLIHKNRNLLSDISQLAIYHSGYLEKTIKDKDKSDRNTKLIEKQTDNAGKTAFDYFNIGNEFMLTKETQNALECYQKAYSLEKDITLEWVPLAAVQIILCFIFLKKYKDALVYIDKGEKIWSNVPEFRYFRGQVFLEQNRFDDAKEQFEELIENKSKYTSFVKSVDYVEFLPYMTLGHIYVQKKDFNMAIKNYTHILSINKYNYEVLGRLISILVKYCPQEEILIFLETHKLSNEKSRLDIIKILLDLFQCDLAEVFINQLHGNIKTKEGIILKLSMLKDEYQEAITRFNNLSDADLNNILKEGFFDWADLFILYLYKKDVNVLEKIKKGVDNKDIIDFLQDGNINSEEDKDIYITLLERCIKYQWFDLFESLLSKENYIDCSIDLEIGHLLCKYNFNELALSFYEKVGDISLLNDAAFVNIIDSLNKLDDKDNALQYALQGIELGYTDFRIFKFAIELSIELKKEDIKDGIIPIVLEQYPDSRWVKQKYNA